MFHAFFNVILGHEAIDVGCRTPSVKHECAIHEASFRQPARLQAARQHSTRKLGAAITSRRKVLLQRLIGPEGTELDVLVMSDFRCGPKGKWSRQRSNEQ